MTVQEFFAGFKKTSIQVIISVTFLLAEVEAITWFVLAFWGIRLAVHYLKKDAERRCLW